MLKFWSAFALCSLLLLACNNEETPTPEIICPEEGECTFDFHPMARLAAYDVNGKTEITGVEPGENRVFYYSYTFDDNPNIADDEYFEEIWLEIPGENGSFSYEGAALAELPCYFRRVCFCPSVEWVPITGGTVTGEPLEGGGWDVTAEVVFTHLGIAQTRSFRGVFQ